MSSPLLSLFFLERSGQFYTHGRGSVLHTEKYVSQEHPVWDLILKYLTFTSFLSFEKVSYLHQHSVFLPRNLYRTGF